MIILKRQAIGKGITLNPVFIVGAHCCKPLGFMKNSGMKILDQEKLLQPIPDTEIIERFCTPQHVQFLKSIFHSEYYEIKINSSFIFQEN